MNRPTLRLIGAPTDRHSSFLRGAAKAPQAIRAALASDHSGRESESGVELGEDVLLEDAGDVALGEAEGDHGLIREAVAAALEAGRIPLVLGGDHSISFPVMEAIAEARGPVPILHFDAHPDLYDDFQGNPHSHASPFARIMESGYSGRLIQVGIRATNRHLRAQAQRFGVETIEMLDFAPERVPVPDGPLYISIDLDGFDPAFAPGVSHLEPGGLTVRDVLAVLHRVRGPIVGADIVELNPSRDPAGLTAALAAKLVKELGALCVEGRP